jgi:hypothetical protein
MALGLVPTEVTAANPTMARRRATRPEDAIYAQVDSREPSASGIVPAGRVGHLPGATWQRWMAMGGRPATG